MAATTIRLPDELDEALEEHCETYGATKNRVVAIALRSYLGEPAPALPVARAFEPEPEEQLPECEQAVMDALRDDLGAREVDR